MASLARGALEFRGPARLDKLSGKALRLEISGPARRGRLRTARSRGGIHQDQSPRLRQVIQDKPQGRSNGASNWSETPKVRSNARVDLGDNSEGLFVKAGKWNGAGGGNRTHGLGIMRPSLSH